MATSSSTYEKIADCISNAYNEIGSLLKLDSGPKDRVSVFVNLLFDPSYARTRTLTDKS